MAAVLGPEGSPMSDQYIGPRRASLARAMAETDPNSIIVGPAGSATKHHLADKLL